MMSFLTRLQVLTPSRPSKSNRTNRDTFFNIIYNKNLRVGGVRPYVYVNFSVPEGGPAKHDERLRGEGGGQKRRFFRLRK